MPRYVVERLREELDLRFGMGLNGARILIVGISYKKNVDDIRESPALAIMELLEGAGAEVDYHDPHFPVIPPTREHHALAGKASVRLEAHLVARYQGAVIVTDHSNVDYDLLLRYSKLVVDTRNVIPRTSQHRQIVARA
jgi:UDP-N-acetyl-D-glucosamine dehydrogenase